MTNGSNGVLYVGTGQKYLYQAIESACTLLQYNDVSVSVITSNHLATRENLDVFDHIISLKDPFDDLRDKINNLEKSPYDRTLYLDGDTIVLGDIAPVFSALDRVDLAAGFATGRYKVDIETIPDCIPELNTGVLAYRDTDNVRELFDLWKKFAEQQKAHGRPRAGERIPVEGANTLEEASIFGNLYGQTPFREALYNSNVQFTILPPEYNYGKMGRGYAQYDVKILHGSQRHELVNVVNEKLGSRQIVNNVLHYKHGSNVRFAGTPVIDPLFRYTKYKIGDLAEAIGVKSQAKLVAEKLRIE